MQRGEKVMLSFLKAYWYLIFVAGSSLISLVRVIMNKRKKAKEENEEYQKKLKNEALNEALRNNIAHHNAFQQIKQATPIDNADSGAQQEKMRQGLFLMRVTMASDGSSYVVSLQERVTLGSAAGQNDIVLQGETIAPRQCEYFMYQGHAFVRNLCPENPVIVRRKKNQASVDGRGIQLLTGDELLIGGYRLQIAFMDYVGNTILG
jgi:hypothetical protein